MEICYSKSNTTGICKRYEKFFAFWYLRCITIALQPIQQLYSASLVLTCLKLCRPTSQFKWALIIPFNSKKKLEIYLCGNSIILIKNLHLIWTSFLCLGIWLMNRLKNNHSTCTNIQCGCSGFFSTPHPLCVTIPLPLSWLHCFAAM